MRISGNELGVSFALVAGFLLFFSPSILTGNGLVSGTLPVDAAHAGPYKISNEHIRQLEAADDAYFDAIMAIERYGETPSKLARLKAADDAYFETVMAMEAAAETARQIARIESADDAYFKAALLIEMMGELPEEQARLEAADDAYFDAVIALESAKLKLTQLAELKAREQMVSRTLIAQANVDDMVTGSLPKNASAKPDPKAMAEQLQKVKEADDAYFDAVIAIESEGESRERLAALKAADDSYFEAVIAIETLMAEAAAAPKNVKVASMAPAAGVEKAAKTPAPANVKRAYAPSPVYKKQVKPGQHEEPRSPLAFLYRVIVTAVGIVPSML